MNKKRTILMVSFVLLPFFIILVIVSEIIVSKLGVVEKVIENNSYAETVAIKNDQDVYDFSEKTYSVYTKAAQTNQDGCFYR